MAVGQMPFDLFETMRFDASDGIVRLELHLARLARSAHVLGFRCDHHAIRNQLQAATFRLHEDAAIRLMLSPTGMVAVAITAMPASARGPVDVVLAPLPVPPADIRLHHETTDRSVFEIARRASNDREVVFVDAEGFVTGGSEGNVFLERGGRLMTPPVTRGLLPGTLRAALLEEGRAVERDLRPEDLASGFLIGNSLDGLMAARLHPAQ